MDAQALTEAFRHGCFAIARGEVFPSEQAEDPLASLTTLLSIKPGTSKVVHGPTTNNSYRIDWHDGSRSRMVFDPTDAAIELFRNGDIEITENGVTTAMTNQTGCFTNELLYPPSIYSHDRTAGAFRRLPSGLLRIRMDGCE